MTAATLHSILLAASLSRDNQVVDALNVGAVSMLVFHARQCDPVCIFRDRSNRNLFARNASSFISFAACRIAGEGVDPARCLWLDASDVGHGLSQVLVPDGWLWASPPADQVNWQVFAGAPFVLRHLVETLSIRFGRDASCCGDLLETFLAPASRRAKAEEGMSARNNNMLGAEAFCRSKKVLRAAL